VVGLLQQHVRASFFYSHASIDSHFETAADSKSGILSTDGQVLHILEGEHKLGLNDIIWIDDAYVITASDDKSMKLWDVEKVNALQNF